MAFQPIHAKNHVVASKGKDLEATREGHTLTKPLTLSYPISSPQFSHLLLSPVLVLTTDVVLV
jgi:hypothetical protein